MLEIKSYTIVCQEKKFSPEVWGKIFLPQTKLGRKYCITGHHHHHLLAFVLQQILKDTADC